MTDEMHTPPEGGWESLKVDELKAELEARGLPKSGTKAELIARLADDDVANKGNVREADAEAKQAVAEVEAEAADEAPADEAPADEAEKAPAADADEGDEPRRRHRGQVDAPPRRGSVDTGARRAPRRRRAT